MTLTVVLHGVESTGKSVLAQRLATRFATTWTPEYGRAYAERHGVDMDEADLLLIGKAQARMIEAAQGSARHLLIADTDSLMTAAWAQMMIGRVPDYLLSYPKADLYLLMEPDVPWMADPVRIYGDPSVRRRFAAICRDILDRAAVRRVSISGDWDARFDSAVRAIKAMAIEKLGFDLDAETG